MNSNNHIEFAKRLKYYLLQNSISQTDFANKLGVSKQSVNNWIKGNRPPNNQTCMNIIEHYNVDARWLFYGITTKETILEEDHTPYINSDRYLKEIIRTKNDLIEVLKNSCKGKDAHISLLHDHIDRIKNKTQSGATSGTTGK